MLKIAAAGGALIVAGGTQLAHHLNRPMTLVDYLAFRCGTADTSLATGATGHALSALGHCWGCYAMAIGAGLLAFAAWRALGLQRPGSPRPV